MATRAKQKNTSADQKKYAKLWERLQKACREHGNSSAQARTIRNEMDTMWSSMSAEDRNTFYYSEWTTTD